MTARTTEMSAHLPCHVCGYDLRAHPAGGKCPECAASVAESIRLAAVPLRPAWRNSDPRWRRRMLAGAWLLVLLPLMDVLLTFGWASRLRVPSLFDFKGALTLDNTFSCNMLVYEALIFCMGVVLLFSKERGRRRDRMDWTRRWGVISSYVVLLLCAAPVLFITALVMAGMAAVFLSLPLQHEPQVTRLFVQLSSIYLLYGPYPKAISDVVVVAFSSITILLACVPLYDALRSSGSKRLAAMLLFPLALFAAMHLSQVARCCLGVSNVNTREVSPFETFFCPQLLVGHIAGNAGILNYWSLSGSEHVAFAIEAAKWCAILAITVWLTIAQIATWRRDLKTHDNVSV